MVRLRFQASSVTAILCFEGRGDHSFHRLQHYGIISFNLIYHYILCVHNLINISFHFIKNVRYNMSVAEEEHAC